MFGTRERSEVQSPSGALLRVDFSRDLGHDGKECEGVFVVGQCHGAPMRCFALRFTPLARFRSVSVHVQAQSSKTCATATSRCISSQIVENHLICNFSTFAHIRSGNRENVGVATLRSPRQNPHTATSKNHAAADPPRGFSYAQI